MPQQVLLIALHTWLFCLVAVARSTPDNRKVYSARVSCIVRDGEAQGVHIVQVRASDKGGE
jgi:hypothetical protein